MDHFQLNGLTGVLPSAPFGSSASLTSPTSDSTLGGTIQGSTSTYTFPASISSGYFMMMYWCSYSTGSATPGGTQQNGASVNCSLVEAFNNNNTDAISTYIEPGGSYRSTQYTVVWEVTGAGASFALEGNAGSMTNPSGGDLYVMQLCNPLN